MIDFTALFDQVAQGRSLSAPDSAAAFAAMATGQVSEIQMAGFLGALRAKGPTIEELTAAVREMRSRMIAVESGPGTIDILGTGGDGKSTFNISTAAAVIVASAGVPVAKQGNRAFSSQCGSADVLTALGATTDLSPRQLEFCLAETGLCFMFAPNHHPALKHVHGVRRALRVRTIFNLMGPLMNAANVKHHLVGVYDRVWLRPMAETLGALGSSSALIVCSSTGMDEFACAEPTHVAELKNGSITEWTFDPDEAGVQKWTEGQLRGGEADENARALRDAMAGQPGPLRDAAALNAGAALYVAGRVETIADGVQEALSLLAAGAPARLLDAYISTTQRLGRGDR